MYLSEPAGCVESTQNDPSEELGAAETRLAEPESCVQFTPGTALSGCAAVCIALAGKIFVDAIGAGEINAGETDWGMAIGVGACGENVDWLHPAIIVASATAAIRTIRNIDQC